jgi:hypothetical protein
MNTMNDLYRARSLSLTDCDPAPPRCSTCGMLECLCRPRFFAGQVLGAEDLNRLDAYIRGKHRLHNRHLHGWGVVNGLEVSCNPCGDGVAVGCGYALSPCGDDIVVCDAVAVDVCTLIHKCRQDAQPWDPCAPFQHAQPQQCLQGEEEWVLAIRYSEAPSRGVKPLRTGSAGTCGCGAGGGPGCSCGAGGGTRTVPTRCTCGGGARCTCGGCGTAAAKGARGQPAQCEATVVCEGFAFEVSRKPPQEEVPGDALAPGRLNPHSPLLQRFECCWMELVTRAPKIPGDAGAITSANLAAWRTWTRAFQQALQRYFDRHGTTQCVLRERLKELVPAGATASTGEVQLLAVRLLVVWVDAMLECFCSALLPPCPQPTEDVRVPIALLHVDAASCKVLRVCNWSIYRKFATTMPALQYWLSLLPYTANLRQQLQAMCCADLGVLLGLGDRTRAAPVQQPRTVRASPGPAAEEPSAPQEGLDEHAPVDGRDPDEVLAAQVMEAGKQRLGPSPQAAQGVAASLEMFRATWRRGAEGLSVGTLAQGLLGRRGDDEGGLSAAEIANLPLLLLANPAGQLARSLLGPMFEGMLHEEAPGPSGAATADVADEQDEAPQEEEEEGGAEQATAEERLRAELAGLREEVASLRLRIESIPRKGPGRKRPSGGGRP